MSEDDVNQQSEQPQKTMENFWNKKFEALQQQVEPQFEPITTLLGKLNDDSLKRPHTSMLISFTQMLDYMKSAIESIKQEPILCLLTTFSEMALKYYTQFELSLLQEIQNQRITSKQSNEVRAEIETRFSNTQETEFKESIEKANSILEKADLAAKEESLRLTESYPTLLQSALDKLKDEWQRLNTIAVANKVITMNEELLDVLDLVVEAARFSVGTEVSRIAVVPGDAFSLQFYAYLKNFAVLTVPIYSVEAPWEWSIFWHELAGDKVRRLERNPASEIEAIRESLRMIHEKWKDKDKTKLIEFITRNNQYTDDTYKDYDIVTWKNNFSQSYLSKFLESDRINWRDLGGFEHQFEQMLENFLSKERFQQYDKIKEDGWCVDWFKELFEDSWSVMAIRKPFIDFQQDVLQRHVVLDGRHPPVKIRVEVARKILELMDAGDANKDPETVIEAAAQQVLAFASLLIVPRMEQVFEMTQVINDPAYWPTLRPQLSDFVGSEIGKYIRKWSDRLSGGITSLKETSEYIKEFQKDLSDAVDYKKRFATSTQQLDDIQPSYDVLLQGKDYQELLALSFSERDFLVADNPTYKFILGTITYSITSEHLKTAITNQWIKGQNPGDTAWSKITLIHLDNTHFADYWTTTTHVSKDLQTVGNILINKVL